MKKFITLLLVLTGCVSTANADWYVTGFSSCTNSSSDWQPGDKANKMTDSNGDGIFEISINKTLSQGTYEYKITDGSWDTTYPSGTGNASFYVHLSGTYTITYTFNSNTNAYSASAQRTTNGSEVIYLRSTKYWDHNDKYKFTQTSGVYTLNVDVSDLDEDFYFRFHVDGWGKDLCANDGTKNHYEIADGLMPEYNMILTGGYYHDNNSDASNFKMPLGTKPLGKIELTIKLVNGNMVLSVQGYQKVHTNSYGLATFVDPNYPLTIPEYTAFYATDNTDGTATAVAITNPDKSTAMIVKGSVSSDYFFPVATSGTDYSTTNAFHAGSGSALASGTGPYNYILNGNTFKAANNQTVGTKKAYLQLSQQAPAGARVLKFEDEDETTGINTVENGQPATENTAVYNLNGQRIMKPTKGLYIQNGKKYIVK